MFDPTPGPVTSAVSDEHQSAAEMLARFGLLRLRDGTTWESLPAEVQERLRDGYREEADAVVALLSQTRADERRKASIEDVELARDMRELYGRAEPTTLAAALNAIGAALKAWCKEPQNPGLILGLSGAVIDARRIGAEVEAEARAEERRNKVDIPALLAGIEANDPSADGTENEPGAEERYATRNALIQHLMVAAMEAGWECGYSTHEVIVDGIRQSWPVAFVELPTGQVSWHLKPHARPYDHHTTAEKYARCRELARGER